jgi:hypothetical protein
LEQLQRCCLAPDVGWRAAELFSKLDGITGTTVFGDLYRAYVDTAQLPDIAEAYRQLGIRVEGGEIVLDDDAPQRDHRDAIMRASGLPPETSSASVLSH